MRALIYHGPGDVRLEERDIPECGPKDVIVRNMVGGICGSDITAYNIDGPSIGIMPGSQLGHEFAGYVCKVGSEVKGISEEMRVFVNPMTRIGDSRFACMANGFSEYVLVKDAAIDYNLFPIADNVSYKDGALIEPFSVGTRGKNMAKPKSGDHIAIYGDGTIGLCALAGLVAQGFDDVIVFGHYPKRLDIAAEIGGVPFNTKEGDAGTFMKEHFGIGDAYGRECANLDVVIDAAGSASVFGDYLANSAPGCRYSTVAVHKKPIEVPFAMIMSKELNIVGSRGYRNEDILEVLKNLENGAPVNKIVTHVFKLEDAKEAFEMACKNKSEAIKVLIDLG